VIGLADRRRKAGLTFVASFRLHRNVRPASIRSHRIGARQTAIVINSASQAREFKIVMRSTAVVRCAVSSTPESRRAGDKTRDAWARSCGARTRIERASGKIFLKGRRVCGTWIRICAAERQIVLGDRSFAP
jgi:hypothetical protein